MIDIFLYSSLSCIEAQAIADRVRKHPSMDAIVKTEIIEVIKEASANCKNEWDAND